MTAIRHAHVIWEGNLANGKGAVTASSSGAFKNLPVTWASRIEKSDGKTSPEELVAAAHASCYAMALSFELGNAGATPKKLEVTAEVTFDKTDAGFSVQSSVLEVRASVEGVSEAQFAQIAQAAKEGCPISRALKGSVKIELRLAKLI